MLYIRKSVHARTTLMDMHQIKKKIKKQISDKNNKEAVRIMKYRKDLERYY